MSQWTEQNDRRQVFRISDRAQVEFRIIEGKQPADLGKLFPDSSRFDLQSDLLLIDEESEHLLRKIAEQDRATAAYLRLMNRKIERIAQSLSDTAPPTERCTISLSEEGLSFESDTELNNDCLLALRITLLPTHTVVLSKARVIYQAPSPQGTHRIGVEFSELDDQSRHLIARHLIEHQARQRRQQRQEQQQQ